MHKYNPKFRFVFIIFHGLGIKIQTTKSILENLEFWMQEVDAAPNHKTKVLLLRSQMSHSETPLWKNQ